jgi:hypothetical protein
VVVTVRDRRGHRLARRRVGRLAGTRKLTIRLKRRVAKVRIVATGRDTHGHRLRAAVTVRRA